MEEYLKLILKKEKYLRRIKEQIKALEKDLLMIQKELQNVYEQNGREYIKLNSLSKKDEEANRTSFVFLIMIVLFIISILAYPFMANFGISSVLSFCYLLGFNLINVTVSFGVEKIIHKYYQTFRLRHSLVIKRQFDLVMESNRKREEVRKKYESLFAKKKDLMKIICEEEKSIQEIKNLIVNTFLQMYEVRNQDLLAVLDKMIEIDVERQCEASNLDYESRLL